VIHYSEFVARRASTVPLLGAIASLAAIAIWLGDPQAGVGTARVPTANGPMITVPEGWNDERSVRVRNTSDSKLPSPTPDAGGSGQSAVLLINRDRAAAGLPPLTESPELDRIASVRAQQMVMDGLTHVRPGSTIAAAAQLLRQNGLPYTWDGENVYWSGGPPFDDALPSAEAWWMASPEHRDNILGSHFRRVGIGTAIDGGKMYIAAVFTD
jgi:uncharacterized protein YkwD